MSAPTSTVRKTKSGTANRMLRRERGATLAEIGKATDWQPHSCRAFLTGVRKTGATLAKEARADGSIAYRVTAEEPSCQA